MISCMRSVWCSHLWRDADARSPLQPARLPIVEKYTEMGVLILMGKLQCGVMKKGDKCVVCPIGNEVKIARCVPPRALSALQIWGVADRSRAARLALPSLRPPSRPEDACASALVLCPC